MYINKRSIFYSYRFGLDQKGIEIPNNEKFYKCLHESKLSFFHIVLYVTHLKIYLKKTEKKDIQKIRDTTNAIWSHCQG